MATALTDHDRIREWAEAHGAVPASVRGTGKRGDPGILRLDMPGGAGNESLQQISWDDWFRKFDRQELALLVDESNRASTFNKLVSRSDVNVDVNPAPRSRGAADDRETMRDEDADVDDLVDDGDLDDDEFEDDDVETDDDEIEDEGDDPDRR